MLITYNLDVSTPRFSLKLEGVLHVFQVGSVTVWDPTPAKPEDSKLIWRFANELHRPQACQDRGCNFYLTESSTGVFPQTVWPQLGFLRWELRPDVHSRWYHTCTPFLMTLTARKFLHLPFSTEVSHKTVARGPLYWRSRFTRAPCSFFELYVHSVWRARHFRDILRSKTSLAWQVQDIVHFFIRVAGVALVARC